MSRHKQVMWADAFASQLLEQCDYFTGVPDGALKKLLGFVAPYYPAPREDHALAMAFGARLMGKKPCVLMQNSGVGYLGDVLLGLTTLYKTGVIMVVGCRGEFEDEEPQHKQWGYRRTTQVLLSAYKVVTLDILGKENAVLRAADYAWRLNRPIALMVRRGAINEN